MNSDRTELSYVRSGLHWKVYFLILILTAPQTLTAQRLRFNPKEKHVSGYRIAKIKYRPPHWIDRRIKNKAIYYDWSKEREAVERSKHPEGGYLTIKLTYYNDLVTPTQPYEVRVMDPDNNIIEKHTIQPGFEAFKPTRYTWEYFKQNQKIIVPLRIKTPHDVKRIAIVNTKTRTVQEFVIICTRGKKSSL